MKCQDEGVTDRGKWQGEWCKRCDRRVIVGFSVPDEIWKEVVGVEGTVWCLACFDEEAERLGVKYRADARHEPIAWWEWREK